MSRIDHLLEPWRVAASEGRRSTGLRCAGRVQTAEPSRTRTGARTRTCVCSRGGPSESAALLVGRRLGGRGPLRRCGREDGLTGKVREVRRDGGTPHRPPKRVGQCSGPCFRSHAGAAEGAAGGGRGERMRQRMGRQGAERGHAVGPRQSGNLSKRRGNFESIVNHGFESRCCGCAGAVSVRSLRPWQMLTPLASPPQVFTAQRACTRPTVARGAGTNAKNIRRCKGGPGQPPYGRAPRACHLLIR